MWPPSANVPEPGFSPCPSRRSPGITTSRRGAPPLSIGSSSLSRGPCERGQGLKPLPSATRPQPFKIVGVNGDTRTPECPRPLSTAWRFQPLTRGLSFGLFGRGQVKGHVLVRLADPFPVEPHRLVVEPVLGGPVRNTALAEKLDRFVGYVATKALVRHGIEGLRTSARRRGRGLWRSTKTLWRICGRG